MKTLFTLLAVSGVFLAAELRATASSIYVLTPSAMTWQQAEAYAISLGGHLVAINSAAEQALLVSQFGGTENLWIGFNDVAVEGTFVWTNGDPVTYTNWAFGEPNNQFGEDATVMNWSAPGNWNDLPHANAGILNRGIVELSIPEPSTFAIFGMFIALGACCWLYRRRSVAAASIV